MRHYCDKCEDEVFLSNMSVSAAKLVGKVKVICDECVDGIDGTWAEKDMFIEEVEAEDA